HPECPRPSMGQDNGHRGWALALDVDEVHGLTVENHPIVGELVHAPLFGPPVEAVNPIFDKLSHRSRSDSVVPVLIVGVRRPPCRLKATSKVKQILLWNFHKPRLASLYAMHAAISRGRGVGAGRVLRLCSPCR